MNIKLAENIKSLRAEKGMSQKELAIRLSVSPQAVSRWENGLAYPDIEMLPRIAELYGVSLDTLMGVGMSFSQRKRKALAQAREQVEGEHDFAGRRRVCEILEELAAEGNGDFETSFLGESLALYRLGGIGVDTVERAREYCRALLKKSSGDDRIRYLMTILSIEDAQNLERWREFVSNDFVFSCWDDLLFWRCLSPNSASKEFETAKQRVVRQSLRKLIMNLVQGRPDRRCQVGSMVFQALNSYETYKLALDIVEMYSTETGDDLPDLKAYIEIRMAAALLAAGRDEEGFATLESILSHIEQTFDHWHDTMLQGDTDEGEALGDELHRCLQGISFKMNRREYDRVRKDSRFIALYRCVEGMDEADKDPLMTLLDDARRYGKREKTRNDTDEVLAVLTADGISRKTVIHDFQKKRDENGAHPDEKAFIDALLEARETEIRYIVNYVGGGVDLPSWFFREKLLELNPTNGEAKMLLNGAFRYITKTVNETSPPKKKAEDAGQ